MRLYYTPIFKGVFSVFSAFIFTLLSIFLFSLIFENIAILLNPELSEYIITSPDDLINKILKGDSEALEHFMQLDADQLSKFREFLALLPTYLEELRKQRKTLE